MYEVVIIKDNTLFGGILSTFKYGIVSQAEY